MEMADNTSMRQARRLTRGPTACQRCRRRKQKCDLKTPSCSNCEEAKAQCLIYHIGKQREIPRNYVANLEAEIAKLTQQVQALRAQAAATPKDETPSAQASSEATTTPEYRHWMSNSLGRVVSEPANQPHFFGMSSGITLARLVMTALRIEDLPHPIAELPSAGQASSSSSYASLPPRRTADHLVGVYFQYRTAHLPIIERARVEQAVESVYLVAEEGHSPDTDAPKNLFITYMIFAIALCSIQHPSGGRAPESEECFNSAMAEIHRVCMASSREIDSLRILLLSAQYISLCPSRGSLWLLTGTALRLAVDKGLHWESEESKVQLDAYSLNERRRLWWSAYYFDRMLCVNLGRPFAIADQSTNVALPDVPSEGAQDAVGRCAQHTGKSHNALFRLAQLESEIKHVLYSHFGGSLLAYPRADYAQWIVDIEKRLKNWHEAIPPSHNAHVSSIFASQAYWDAIYNNALLLLYRPSPIVPEPTLEAINTSFDASCKLISCIKTLHRERKIDIMWKWVHHIFMAGLTTLYCLWHSNKLRDRVEVSVSIATLQSCGSTLSALSERWEGASGCRDAFETLSSATIDWLITANAEERQSRLGIEKHLQDLQQQLPPTFFGETTLADPFTMMSTGTFVFGFGESLNSAAEWPAMQQFDMNDFDSMIDSSADVNPCGDAGGN